MLGEKVGSISGPTAMKALPAVNGSPSFETVASGLSGTLAGTEVSSFATYAATMRTDGSFYGECPNSGVRVVCTRGRSPPSNRSAFAGPVRPAHSTRPGACSTS